MADLKARLAETDRDLVIRDSAKLIDAEVGSKSGVTGLALRGGYKVVKRLRGGRMIEEAVDYLLDDFTDALDPMYQEFLESDDDTSFERFLRSRTSEAADALLAITDGKAKRAENKVLLKTYNKLRGQAKKHVEDALPGVGRLIDDHAPKE
jgi:hypothetical protein